MSDPPYYTACPNPFLGDFIKHYGRPYDPDVLYSRKPFAVDVSEGKTDSIYKAHAYHTKVPHLAIVPSILHYTEPGDIVLDGFCGSGMTGVAAQWCGTAPEKFRRELEAAWEHEGFGKPQMGPASRLCNATFHPPQRSLLPITTYRSTWMPSCRQGASCLTKLSANLAGCTRRFIPTIKPRAVLNILSGAKYSVARIVPVKWSFSMRRWTKRPNGCEIRFLVPIAELI